MGGLHVDKELRKAKNKTKFWEQIENTYNITLVSTAKEGAKAVPGPGVAIAIGDAFFDSVIQRQVAKNRQELLKCLKSASSDITLTNVSDEEFIMDYVNLQNVTDRLRSNEKIQIMANLFVSAHCGDTLCNFDEYDEMLERINSLSLREITLLRILHKHGESTRAFYAEAENELHLSEDITNSLLTSITKTGFCKEKTGAMLNYNGNSFYTTDLFSRLLVLIKVEDGLTVEERERRKKAREEGLIYERIVEDVK